MCLTQVQKNVNVLSSPSITTSLYILVPHKYIANDYFQSNNIFISSLRSGFVTRFVNTTIIFDHSKVGSWAESQNCFFETFPFIELFTYIPLISLLYARAPKWSFIPFPFPFEFFGSVKFFTQWNLTFSIHLPSTLYLWPTQTSFAQMVFSSTISYFVSFTICRWWWWWGSNRFPRFHSMILISSNPQLVQPTCNCCKTALILSLCWTSSHIRELCWTISPYKRNLKLLRSFGDISLSSLSIFSLMWFHVLSTFYDSSRLQMLNKKRWQSFVQTQSTSILSRDNFLRDRSSRVFNHFCRFVYVYGDI